MAEGVMSAFLTNIGTFFTTAVEWVGKVIEVVTSNPALTVLVLAMPICGFAVGLVKRLISL